MPPTRMPADAIFAPPLPKSAPPLEKDPGPSPEWKAGKNEPMIKEEISRNR